MKTFLLSIFALAIVAGPVLGEDDDYPKKNKQNPPPQRQVNPVAPRTFAPRVQNNIAPKPQFELRNKPTLTARTYTPRSYPPQVQPRLRSNSPRFTPVDPDAPQTTVRSDTNLPNREWRNRFRNRNNPNGVTPQPPLTPTTAVVQSNVYPRNQFDRDDRRSNDRNWNSNNRNWQNKTSGTFTFDEARRCHDHHHHDHGWWRNHYNRFVLFGGGYYYWNNNYWYPAYGYDPYYSSYTYDEPIYGYNDLPPGQVIANVQSALQEQGYYRDAVDGLIGPNTRAALSRFQRDQGLPITAAIDGPTLQALRLS